MSAAVEVLDVNGRSTLVARAGSGPPLLYLHGLVGDIHATRPPEEWTPFLDRVAATHTVVAPAHPGWPGTDATAIDGRDDDAFHLCDLLDGLGFDAVDVVGSSVGAWLAAELAVRHPDRVASLVLVAPLGVHTPAHPPEPFFRAVAPRGVGGFGEARRLLYADPEGDAACAALPDDMDEAAQLRWFGGLAGAARLGWQWPHFQSRWLTRHLWRVRVPTSLVFGEADRLAPPAHVPAWTVAIPQARVEIVDGAGHALTAEKPDAVF